MQPIISPMLLSDLEQIQEELETQYDDFWTFSIFKAELENSNSYYFVAKQEDEIRGFAGVWISVDDIHITNIVTKKTCRSQGIGTQLLETLIVFSKTKQKTALTLEVNENNIPAIKLYEKYNFKKIGIRKNYYSQNENAIIMTLYF